MTHAVKTEWIRMPTGGGEADAFLALPPAGSGPGLVLWQEIFGVNDHIRAVAGQYALEGFVVLAPDVFWRQERRLDIGYAPADMQRGRGFIAGMNPDEIAADIDAAVATLRARPEAAGRKLGSIGYCMGGRLAFLTAARQRIDAAVAYYGGGIHDQLDRADTIACPVLFHYAERDEHIPPAAVDKVRSAMAGKGEVHVYPGAQHGFNCWARGSYDAASSVRARGRTLSFLAEHLF